MALPLKKLNLAGILDGTTIGGKNTTVRPLSGTPRWRLFYWMFHMKDKLKKKPADDKIALRKAIKRKDKVTLVRSYSKPAPPPLRFGEASKRGR